MPNKTINLQDVFLNQVRKENVAGKQMMVYKHAISTISPLQPLKNSFQDNKRTETVSE